MKLQTYIIIIAIFFIVSPRNLVKAEISYNNEKVDSIYSIITSDLKQGIDCIFKEDFNKAKLIYSKIIENYPNHAIGYFAMASLFYIQKDLYETTYFDRMIAVNFSKVKKITERYLEQDANALYYYLLGNIKLNESYLEVKSNNLLSAFIKAIDGIGDIERSINCNPNFIEPKFLLGSYIYFRNKLHSLIYDSRELGIALITEVVNDSKNVNAFFAITVLANIYLDKEEYDKAKFCILKALKQYPKSRVFLYIYSNILFQDKKYFESIEVYSQIEQIILDKNPKKFRNGFNFIYCNYRKIVSFYKLKNYDKVKELLVVFDDRIKNKTFKDESLVDRLEEIHDEIDEIRRMSIGQKP